MGSIPPSLYNNSPHGPPPSHNNLSPYHHTNGLLTNGAAAGSRASSTSAPLHHRFMHYQDSAMGSPHRPTAPSLNDGNFDILEWHPAYVSCQRYFLNHAQYEPGTQAVCALINIRLPFQWLANPVTSSSPSSSSSSSSQTESGSTFGFNPFGGGGGGGGRSNSNSYSSPQRNNEQPLNFASPVPYIRRLVVTGFDKPAILHGFFGDEYMKGIMPHVECERRNYLFAAKHGGWRSCKRQYDNGSGGGGDETVPFMKPLDEVKAEELTAAEKAWSGWLAMEDWMVGPRAPDEGHRDAATYGRTGGHRGGGVSMRDNLPDGMPDGMPDGV